MILHYLGRLESNLGQVVDGLWPYFLALLILRAIYVLTRRSYNEELLKAAERGDLKAVQAALNNKANIEYRDSRGASALLLASISGNLDVCTYLINSMGAKVNTDDNNRGTPLMAAAVGGHFNIAQLLINNGARVKAKRADSSTALIFAARNGNFEMVKFFCESGSDILWKNSDGLTAITAASEKRGYRRTALSETDVIEEQREQARFAEEEQKREMEENKNYSSIRNSFSHPLVDDVSEVELISESGKFSQFESSKSDKSKSQESNNAPFRLLLI